MLGLFLHITRHSRKTWRIRKSCLRMLSATHFRIHNIWFSRPPSVLSCRWFVFDCCSNSWISVIILCFAVRYFVSNSHDTSFAIILMEKRELLVLQVSRDCCVALHRGATGLSAVYDCGITWSYSLTLFQVADSVDTDQTDNRAKWCVRFNKNKHCG